MNKKALSERDICSKFITPALQDAGWDLATQIREEFDISPGRIIVRGKVVSRGRPRRADYVLSYKQDLPIAVIEAKDNSHALGDGLQQALGYAESLGVPFVFASNGDGFVFHDRTATGANRELTLPLAASPRPPTSGSGTAPGAASRPPRKKSSSRTTSPTAATAHPATTRCGPSTPPSRRSPRDRTASSS